MADYRILTDSTCDLPQELAQASGIEAIPLLFTVDGTEYQNTLDNLQLSPRDFYAVLRGGKTASTSQINVEKFRQAFEPLLAAGTDILYIAFSSALSGTCSNAAIAAKDLLAQYPGRKLLVLDSLSASMGEGLLVYLAALKKARGENIEQVYGWLEKNRLHLCHWFTVDDLNFLRRGGRISPAAAIVGSMLGIKPILHVDNEGRLIPMGKVRGRRQSLEALVEKMAQSAEKPEEQTVFISHGDCASDATYVADAVKNRFHPAQIIIGSIGPVIGAHSGPGTVALFFLGRGR